MNKKLTKNDVELIINKINSGKDFFNIDYIYDIYDASFDAIEELLKSQNASNTYVDSIKVVSYILGEYIYSTGYLNKEELAKFLANEEYMRSMASVASDKYVSLSLYKHHESSLTNEYLPPISSLQLYINLMLNIMDIKYSHNNPKSTLVVDLLKKSLSISQSIINMLCDGYATGAFALWRTLHECECTLILLGKYGDLATNSYLKHMKYGLAFRNVLPTKEETDKVFEQIKKEMSSYDLKSKDMKKYIEYGWLYPIQKEAQIDGFKLNFRDGLEQLAGLHSYSELYMMSSEILHSTPLLIYSNKEYFHYLTLLNLYESFFRVEQMFTAMFLTIVSEEEKTKYLEMRKLYYSQLVNIHKRESIAFKNISQKKSD